MGGKLRFETSINCSGKIVSENNIPALREKDYIVKNYNLDGDSPKNFIRVYNFTPDSQVRRVSPNS